MDFITKFRHGKWFSKSNSLLSDKAKLMLLLSRLTSYVKKGGLAKVRTDLELMSRYVQDIIKGNYKKYSGSMLTLSVASILYVVSPLDIIPDFIPFTGYVDDISIVTWALTRLAAELEQYKQWLKGPEDIPFEEIK